MKGIARLLCIAAFSLPPAILVEQKPASAWMDLCNNTGDSIYVAFGWSENGDWNSKGWELIRDTRCLRFWHHELKNSKQFYYLAMDRAGNNITPSKNTSSFCAKSFPQNFDYKEKGVKDFCGTNGTNWYRFAGFQTSGRNFTFRLN